MKEVKLGILDCDELADELQSDYGCYSAMFKTLFKPRLQNVSDDIQYVRYDVLAGQVPSDIEACDAYLVTGSKTGVYDDAPWLPLLSAFLVSAYAQRKRLIGICFGHQLLADILGGKAEKSDKGWGVGTLEQTHQFSLNWMQPMPDSLKLLYSHQDQVTKLPEEAVCIYGSDFCPNGAFYIAHRVLCFQGHPEFTKDYCQRLMILRQARYAPGQFERASKSLTQMLDEQVVAKWMIAFVKGEDET